MKQLTADLSDLIQLLSNPLNWGKHDMYAPRKGADNGFCYCLAGALGLTSGTIVKTGESHEHRLDGESVRRYNAMRSAIRETLVNYNTGYPEPIVMTCFNDSRHTTHAMLMDMLHQTLGAHVLELNAAR